METDAALLGRYLAGDEQAFHALVERRFGLVYAVALRQVGGDAHLARDVAQGVFVALARQAGALAGRPVLSGWLHGTARHMAIDLVRSERRRRERERASELMPDLSDRELSDADWQSVRPVLDDALSELGERDRDAIMLRVWDGLSFGALGAALRSSEDAARMRFERALEKLRVRLRRRGVTSTAAALTLVLTQQGTAAVPAGLASAVAGAAVASAKLAGAAASVGALAIGAGGSAGEGVSAMASGGAGGSTGGIFSFMTATKTVGTLAGAALAVALGVGWYYTRVAQRLEAATAEVAREVAALQQEDAARGRAASSATGATATGAAAGAKANANASAAGGGESGAPGSAALAAQVAQMRTAYEARQRLRANDPEFQRLALRAAQVSHRLDYAGLLRELALTPEQRARFEALLLEREGAQFDLTGARLGLGLARDDAALRAETARQERAFAEKLQAALGAEAAEAFRRYEAAAPVRELVGQVVRGMCDTDTPFTRAQAQQLEQTLARHLPNFENLDPRFRSQPETWAAVVRDSRTFLAPAQLAVLAAYGREMPWVIESVHELNRPGGGLR